MPQSADAIVDVMKGIVSISQEKHQYILPDSFSEVC